MSFCIHVFTVLCDVMSETNTMGAVKLRLCLGNVVLFLLRPIKNGASKTTTDRSQQDFRK